MVKDGEKETHKQRNIDGAIDRSIDRMEVWLVDGARSTAELVQVSLGQANSGHMIIAAMCKSRLLLASSNLLQSTTLHSTPLHSTPLHFAQLSSIRLLDVAAFAAAAVAIFMGQQQ